MSSYNPPSSSRSVPHRPSTTAPSATHPLEQEPFFRPPSNPIPGQMPSISPPPQQRSRGPMDIYQSNTSTSGLVSGAGSPNTALRVGSVEGSTATGGPPSHSRHSFSNLGSISNIAQVRPNIIPRPATHASTVASLASGSLHPARSQTSLTSDEDTNDSDSNSVASDLREALEEERERERERGQGERGLETTLERLGFGAYHWRLFALCGCGWMSDNSALVCVSVILPRVQVHWGLTEKVVGFMSASIMAGMMIGAVSWGLVSDIVGRQVPFNLTLLLTALFGIASSFAPTFPLLCVGMFFMGTAVGGSMPTDGTLFIENLPHSKQYLLTLLSVFFSLGSVVSSTIGMAILPGRSCESHDKCDFENGANDGWRRVLFVLSTLNLICALARFVAFKLHESPRFLVSNGRPTEAVVVLRAIAKYNDENLTIEVPDVQQAAAAAESGISQRLSGEYDPEEARALMNGGLYEAVPVEEVAPPGYDESVSAPPYTLGNTLAPSRGPTPGPRSPISPRRQAARLRKQRHSGPLAAWHAWVGQMSKLFAPKWRRTVILMWLIWGTISFAYTMFNVWLPSVLEMRQDGDKIKGSLHDVVLYSIAGCPGSLVGAWLIQTKLGRQKSLAFCTLATAISVFAFIPVHTKFAMVVSSMFISLTGTAMYAVLYGMTPETFGTSIRGTACGTSSAISRLTGVVAPVAAGQLLSLTPSLPLYISAVAYIFAMACCLGLPKIKTRKGGAAVMH